MIGPRIVVCLFVLCFLLVLPAELFPQSVSAPVKTFEIDFSKGLTAEFAKGDPAPVKTGKFEFCDGIRGGKAIHVPKNGGGLLYRLPENFPKKRGTILLWLKPDWSTAGVRSWDPDFRGIFCTARDGKVPGPAKLSNGNQLGAVQYGVLLFHWSGEPQGLGQWEERRDRFPPGVWNCCAFTWDDREGMAFFLNGRRMQHTTPRMERSIGDADGFYLGSANFHGTLRGYDGSLARVEIYDGILSGEAIRRKSFESLPSPMEILLDDSPCLVAGGENEKRFAFSNWTGGRVSEKLRFVTVGPDGAKIGESVCEVAADPGKTVFASVKLRAPSPGGYSLDVFAGGVPVSRVKLVAIAKEPLRASMPLSTDGATRETLLETIDCAQTFGPDKYRDDGVTRVEKSALGSWRESFGGKRLSGFLYQLAPIRNPDRPHWLEIEYPDNAQRQFYVAVFQDVLYDGTLDTIGVLTGGMHPVTNTMQKKRLLFWPNSKTVRIGCYSHARYEGDHGPALARISLYEIDGPLPQLEINLPKTGPRRMIGLWQEDPYMTRAIWFNKSDGSDQTLEFWREKWNRAAEYLLYSGQNVCDMPIFSYKGDASESEGYTPGWADVGAAIFQREGLNFLLTVHDLPMNSYIQGPGGLAKAVGVEKLSWTLDEALKKGERSLERFVNDDGWSASGGARNFPRLNPLHPDVQAGYLKIIREYAERFARYESFRGFSFVITDSRSNLFYRSLDEGYGDWSVRQFEKDTGVKVPVPSDARDRFSKRYRWLMKNAKEKWIRWRAGRLAKFYAQMAKTLQEAAPGRKIVIITRFSGDDFAKWPFVPDLGRTWLERGVDFGRIASIDGFLFAPPSIKPNAERAGLNTAERKNGELKNSRYYAFSPELAAFQPGGAVALIQQSTFETYTNYAPEQVKPVFPPRETRSTCHLAYSIPHPDNRYELENLARLFADFNPEIVLNGWWGCPDNGAIDVYQPFYRAVRSIPAIPFRKVPGAGDPVQVKYGAAPGSAGFYLLLVNRECYPVGVELELDGRAGELRDVVENRPVKLDGGRLALSVKPYQVLCFESASPFAVRRVAMQTPPEAVADLNRRLDFLKRSRMGLPPKELRGGGLPEVIGMADKALAAREYSRLHYLLQSDPAYRFLRKIDADPVSVGEPKLLMDESGAFRLWIPLRNETPGRLAATVRAQAAGGAPGDSVRTEFPVFGGNTAGVSLPGTFAPRSAVGVTVSVEAAGRDFAVSRKVSAPIVVEEGAWTRSVTLGADEASFSLSREGNDLLVKTLAKDALRIRGTNFWTGACVGIFVDLDPLRGLDGERPQDFHSRCLEIDVPAFQSGPAKSTLPRGELPGGGTVSANIKDIPGGYEAVVRIPLGGALGALPGKNIGIAVAVDRIDGGNKRNIVVSAGNEFWENRAEFAAVHFR